MMIQDEKAVAEESAKRNPHYKTSLCKSGTSCRNVDICQFAHVKSELRED
jgi:hypothetical protein